ncbi:Zinc finger protein [Plakobranchus ocellatus]|uniref:Zinc finger protein n=1 Tax=Plakobranchus ocellatus TaxID=259542 RepID=A0AAV3Z9F9_9GAST|nr:Zinc finger protein [Plakobranchus ocellatus]
MDSALHYTSVSHAHSLVGNINKMRLAADLCDVTVVVGNFRILAHRVVLSACTPFFYQMFYASSKIPSEYRLDNVDETAALKIIEFCYTSAISVTPDLAWPLLAAAALVELPEICGLCCDLLASDLSLTSCLAMHLSAVRLGEKAASQLLKASSQFLEENVAQLSTSQQLYDLSEHELIELFKSLSPASAHACSKLAIAWLKRSDVSSQVLVIEKLKQSCPHLVETLTDFLSRSASPAAMTAKDDNAHNDTDAPETPISIAGTGEASYSVDNSSSSRCWNDSGFSETVRRVASGDCEEEDDMHICARCGDTFDGRDQLLAHQRRQCEDECDQVLKSTQGDDSGSKLDVNSAQGAQRVCERKEAAMSNKDSPPVKLSVQTRSKNRKRVDTLRKAGSNESDGNLTVFEAEKVSPLGSDGAVEKEETDAKDSEKKEQTAVVNGWETPEANDSNNNDINAKSTADVDSPDDIDVVNDDAPSLSATCDKPEEKSKGSDGPSSEMLRYQNTLAQGFEVNGNEQDVDSRLGLDISGMKCQFCGLTVFDDEDELALHWKEVHGVCQDTTHQLNREATEESQPQNCNALERSYLKRSSGGEDAQEGLDASLKTPVKRPKAENVNGDTDLVSPEMKSEILRESKLTASPERWPLKSEDLARVKMGEDDSMAGFLQYVQQYNELAKWYMEQGVLFCSSCMAYHDKDSQCQKAKVDFKHREAESVQGLKTNGSMVNLKQEGKSSGFNEIDEGGVRENKTQNHLEVDDEEGPLDMSKTSQDFTSPCRDLSRYASSQQTPPETVAGAMKRDQGIRHSKDAHYLTQQQLELAQYYESYSRMMAAVAAVSASSTSSTGSRDPAQFGFPGLYGANSSSIGLGSVPAGFGHSGMFVQASASGPDADGKPAGALMPAHSGGQDAFSERMIYGTSAAASPPGSLLGKVYGKNLGSPSDMAVYQSQSTVPPAHRRQQTSLPVAHALHETSASAESTAMLKSSFPISPEASLNQNPSVGESVGSGKSQSRKKQGSRQGFPCTVCNRVFSYQAALFTHMKVHSPSARTYQCQLCRRTFDRAPDLKVHVCPNGVEKPYVCPSCGQTFAKNIHLKRHLATHSGLKPYPCWVCGKRFSRSDHLKRHTQSIHAGSRPHGCQLCGKEFVRKYELNKHMLIHTNIVNGEPAESASSQQNQGSPQHQSEALPSASANPQAVSMQLPVLPTAAST